VSGWMIHTEVPIESMSKKRSPFRFKKIDMIFAAIIVLVLVFALQKGNGNSYTIVGVWKPVDQQQELMNLYFNEDGDVYFFEDGYDLYSEAFSYYIDYTTKPIELDITRVSMYPPEKQKAIIEFQGRDTMKITLSDINGSRPGSFDSPTTALYKKSRTDGN
jgi:hypothetical protein